MALQLRRHGIRHVRPLLGGYYAWKELGYPLESVLPDTELNSPIGEIATNGAA